MGYKPHSFSTHVPADKIEMIGGFPTPPRQSVAPLHAFTSVLKLLANKEDTRQVFEAAGALAGGSFHRLFEKLVATEYGRRLVTEPIELEQTLGDREALRAMPAGSVGRAYLDFMEGENLTPEGITDAAGEAGLDYTSETQFPEMRRMSLHLEVSHDLWHVLTGYNRDTLGELCLLVFTHRQTRNSGLRLITTIGAIAGKAEQFSTQILSSMKEAERISNEAAWFPAVDFIDLLPMQLDEARCQLNVSKPTIYNSVPQEDKDRLLKPRVKETQAQREGALA